MSTRTRTREARTKEPMIQELASSTTTTNTPNYKPDPALSPAIDPATSPTEETNDDQLKRPFKITESKSEKQYTPRHHDQKAANDPARGLAAGRSTCRRHQPCDQETLVRICGGLSC